MSGGKVILVSGGKVILVDRLAPGSLVGKVTAPGSLVCKVDTVILSAIFDGEVTLLATSVAIIPVVSSSFMEYLDVVVVSL